MEPEYGTVIQLENWRGEPRIAFRELEEDGGNWLVTLNSEYCDWEDMLSIYPGLERGEFRVIGSVAE